MLSFIKIAVVALSLALDVFAVCIGVGMRGTDLRSKLRIGAAFATAEIGMNVIGALLGATVGRLLGDIAGYLGFAALVGVGIYMIVETLGEGPESGKFDLSRGWGLFIGALSISLDSLGIGFSILFIGVPIYTSLAFIAAASIGATAAGLSLGKRLGARAEAGSARWAGIVLVITGLGFAAAKYFHIG